MVRSLRSRGVPLRRPRWAGIALLLPLAFLCGAKCYEYDPTLSETDESSELMGSATPCDVPGEAQILVEEFAFRPLCGCAESDDAQAHQCTVPPGTTVRWRFAGSLEHNINSDDGGFPNSEDRSQGDYSIDFTAPGAYPYGCSLHPGEMSNYTVRVVEESDP